MFCRKQHECVTYQDAKEIDNEIAKLVIKADMKADESDDVIDGIRRLLERKPPNMRGTEDTLLELIMEALPPALDGWKHSFKQNLDLRAAGTTRAQASRRRPGCRPASRDKFWDHCCARAQRTHAPLSLRSKQT